MHFVQVIYLLNLQIKMHLKCRNQPFARERSIGRKIVRHFPTGGIIFSVSAGWSNREVEDGGENRVRG